MSVRPCRKNGCYPPDTAQAAQPVPSGEDIRQAAIGPDQHPLAGEDAHLRAPRQSARFSNHQLELVAVGAVLRRAIRSTVRGRRSSLPEPQLR